MIRTTLRGRLARNAAILAGGNGLGALLTMAAVAVNSRALTLEAFGTVALLQSSALLLSGFIGFSTQQPVIKLGIAALAAGERERFERLVAMGLVADGCAAAVAAVLGLIAVALLPSLIGLTPSAGDAALIVAASLAFQGYRTAEGVFRAFDRFDLMSAIQVLAAGVQLIAALILWQVKAPFVAYGWLVAMGVALPSLMQLAAALALLHRRGFAPRFPGIAVASPDRADFIAFCWTTNFVSSLDALRANGDSLAVGALLSVEAAGIYNVAKQLAGVVRKLNAVYASVLFPELAALAAHDQSARAVRLLRRTLAAAFGVTAAAVLGATVLGGVVLAFVFGEAMRAGHLALVLLIAAAGLQLVAATLSMYVQAFCGQARLAKAYGGAIAGFLLVLGPALLALGIAGAGLAQIVFIMLLALLCWLPVRRRFAAPMESVPCE